MKEGKGRERGEGGVRKNLEFVILNSKNILDTKFSVLNTVTFS